MSKFDNFGLDLAWKIGHEKLGFNDRKWEFGLAKAKEIEVAPEDMGPMVLALGLLQSHSLDRLEDAERELSEALELVAKATKEYRLEHLHS